MNKTARTAKVYAISLSLIFLANVLFLQGNNSIISIQVAQSENFPTKTTFITKHAGDNITLTSNPEVPGNFTVTQTRGPDVLDGKGSVSGHNLTIETLILPSLYRLAFNVTSQQGSTNLTQEIIALVMPDNKPIAVVDNDQTLDIQKFCNPENSSLPVQSPQFDLNGKGIDEGPLTYSWSTFNDQSMINIKDPHSAKTTFTVKNLCNQVGQTNIVFLFNVTDPKLQFDEATLQYTFNNPNPPFIDFIS